eukprot:1147923-Pelagomonas_calceolata.AAC.4
MPSDLCVGKARGGQLCACGASCCSAVCQLDCPLEYACTVQGTGCWGLLRAQSGTGVVFYAQGARD